MDRWLLPGAVAFLESVVGAIRDGANVVVGAPVNASGALAHVLEDRLADDNWRLAGPLKPSGRQPIDEIYARLEIDDERGPSGRTVASLIARLEDKRVVIVSAVDNLQWPAWARFLDEYANACRSVDKFDRTQLLLVTSGVPVDQLPANAPALHSLAWNGQIGEGDVFGYVLQCWRTNGMRIDARAKLVARIVTRLALWDFDLADRLLKLDWQDLFEPTVALRSVDDDRWTWGELGSTWEEGGLTDFDGERMAHALVLHRNGDPKRELVMRLWAAQAAELMPALELKRRQLADRMRASRGLPSSLRINGEPVLDLNDVEIGGLLHLARVHRLPQNIIQTAQRYRDIRNKLAHLEPVSADEALYVISGKVGQ